MIDSNGANGRIEEDSVREHAGNSIVYTSCSVLSLLKGTGGDSRRITRQQWVMPTQNTINAHVTALNC